MRHKRLKLSAILLFGLGLTLVQAQYLNVKTKSGTLTVFPNNSIIKLTFSSGNIIVNKTIGRSNIYALNDIQNIQFTNSINLSITPLQNSIIFSRPDLVNYLSNDHPLMYSEAWTWSGVFGLLRTLLQYDLTQIPQNAVIQSATLNLKGAGHNPLTHSNSSTLNLVTQSWDYTNATWTNMNNKYTTTGNIAIPGTASGATNENKTVDLKSMVQYWVNNPQSNYGMMLKLDNETRYATMRFGTDNNTNSALLPVLNVSYVLSSQKSSVGTIFDETLAANPANLITPEGITSDSTLFDINIIISPNPASDFINVATNAKGDELVSYEIYNSGGKIEAYGQISMNKVEKIGIESLSQGIYFIKLKYKNEAISKKFMVKK